MLVKIQNYYFNQESTTVIPTKFYHTKNNYNGYVWGEVVAAAEFDFEEIYL
jgi:hypothetical protein